MWMSLSETIMSQTTRMSDDAGPIARRRSPSSSTVAPEGLARGAGDLLMVQTIISKTVPKHGCHLDRGTAHRRGAIDASATLAASSSARALATWRTLIPTLYSTRVLGQAAS
jgi:hypothetical protein